MVSEDSEIRRSRRDKILAARAMEPMEKLFAGADLFAYACDITMLGIRAANPGISDDDARAELSRRLAIRAKRGRG